MLTKNTALRGKITGPTGISFTRVMLLGPLFMSGTDRKCFKHSANCFTNFHLRYSVSRNLYFSIIRNLTSLCKKNLYYAPSFLPPSSLRALRQLLGFGAKARDVTPDLCALLLNREERSTNTLFYFELQSHNWSGPGWSTNIRRSAV